MIQAKFPPTYIKLSAHSFFSMGGKNSPKQVKFDLKFAARAFSLQNRSLLLVETVMRISSVNQLRFECYALSL